MTTPATNEEVRFEFSTGAVRGNGTALDHLDPQFTKFPARLDLVSPVAIRRLAQAYGEGAAKYPPGNWTKGIPESSCINHCLSHIYAYLSGDASEDHIGHAMWNLATLAHNQEKRPDLMDLDLLRDAYSKSVPSAPSTQP